MAPAVRQISREEWNRHEDTIRRLHSDDKLQLKSNEGKRTLIDVMKDEHGFSASLSQYESKFREWGLVKYLKKRDWQQLLWQHKEVLRQSREARIVVSGSVAEEPRLKRARRWCEPDRQIGHTIPPEKQAYVEFRDGTGPWSRYTDDGTTAEPSISTQNPFHGNTGAQGDGNAIASVSDLLPTMQILEETVDPPTTSHMELVHVPAATHSSFNWSGGPDMTGLLDNPLRDPDGWGFLDAHIAGLGGTLTLDPFNDVSVDNALDHSRFQQGQSELMDLGIHQNFSPYLDFLSRPEVLATALVQRSREPVGNNKTSFRERELPTIEDVMDSLDSLLPEDGCLENTTPGFQTIERNTIFGPVVKKLLYSIINNFAGLRNIPPSAILNLVRVEPQIQTQLYKLLSESPSSIAKPLADNLFRAAIESGDAQAVGVIMSITRDKPEISIDPNNLACNFNGRDYTPIELAAKFGNIDIVRALLKAEADPNKSYMESELGSAHCGALELAIVESDKFEQVNMELVKLLLTYGAVVRLALVERIVRRGHANRDLFELMMDKFQGSKHPAIFESESIFMDLVAHLENRAAAGLVQSVFRTCESTNCGECASSQPKLLRDLLVKAAKRGNIDLVLFLLNYTQGSQLALAAAIRSRNSKVIDVFVKSATVDGPADYLYDFTSDIYGNYVEDFPVKTTPLAEAIRIGDNSLVRDLEEQGALDCIDEYDHFVAATCAAAEFGDVEYIHRILESVPAYHGQCLTPALCYAIRKDHSEAALVLLDAGAFVNETYTELSTHARQERVTHTDKEWSPLLEALKHKNARVVEVILESDLYSRENDLGAAAVWGNLEIIEDLVLMGAGPDTTGLTTAVSLKNEPLVHLLLQLGATANPRALVGGSPLAQAVQNGDHRMMEFLMSRGASVIDDQAFAYAKKHDILAYNMLLSGFGKLHPREQKGFGGNLLIDAIEGNDLLTFNALLEAKVDINRMVRVRSTGEGNYIVHRRTLSPLGSAIQYADPELVRKLLQAGGDPNTVAARFTVRTLDESIQHLQTPLLLAIQTRNETMAEVIVKGGADVNRPARRGVKRTPLQEACAISSFKMVKFLLMRGADVNGPAPYRNGHTALQLAAINGSIKIARLLLDNGADPHGAPSKVGGRTAFEGAAENGCLDMLGLLWTAAQSRAFDEKERKRARGFADAKGHRSCVEYIDSLDFTPFLDFEVPSGMEA
ncbi:hypothetical protein F4780DRAFT_40621 [Xylariomycetidae sp. FL0641]|nr:hypothetical protein F4780DRAFT_40621 [Xylariomycetidae sp. FL0641]